MARARKPPMCMVCHLAALPGMSNLVECARSTFICRECAEAALLCFEEKAGAMPRDQLKDSPAAAARKMMPGEIVALLNQSIIGQDMAKRALAAAVWKHMQRQQGNTALPPAHVLLYGPSGSGKTYLAKSIAKIMDVPFVCVDATTFSEAGYRGRDVTDIVFDILDAAETRKKAQNAVVFIDEFDKLSARGGSERQAYQRGTQHGFLTLIEGGIVSAERRYDTATLDVSGILFIFSGAFGGLADIVADRTQGNAKRMIGFGQALKSTEEPDPATQLAQAIPEDFVSYGLETELIGRIPVLAPLQPLQVDDLVRILIEAKGSVYSQYFEFFKKLNKDFVLEPAAAEELAHIAYNAGTGARGLRGRLERVITDLLFDLPTGDSITITKDKLRKGDGSL